ncbi:nucleotidyltransferase [Aphanothece hegewaldii CCALA 016]|uniref:Nucleotidyltransferase n=1 Tax=Aphanothece hegewaldii CCALA 016 TaxID=2107694 RepID=A0A2T1LWM5_9CHRO|nr:nucleotidyltransferase domain-containing protein [Aphanothece hegewaldii]PSF36303.1 nucleotidyltransferase [Aphanothece hegewaldii CCALA 016]
MNPNLTEILDQLRQYFQKLYGDRLAYLILYGSQARGDADPDSDIDILVVLNDAVDAWTEINRTSQYISELCLKYDTLISRNFASKSRYQLENSPFYMNVRREGILL